jgi:hypothetical protein
MNVWEYSYLCPESLRTAQGISDKLERMNIGLYVLRRQESILGVKPPHVVKVSSEWFKGVRSPEIRLNSDPRCSFCGQVYHYLHYCVTEAPAANGEAK